MLISYKFALDSPNYDIHLVIWQHGIKDFLTVLLTCKGLSNVQKTDCYEKIFDEKTKSWLLGFAVLIWKCKYQQ